MVNRYLKKYKKSMRFRLPAAAVLLILFVLPSDGLGFSVCIFYHIFGIPCPVCGLTRSMSSMLHLEWLKSFAYHPLGVLILGFVFMCLITNDPSYLSSKIKEDNKYLRILISAKSLSVLFILVWIFRL